MNIEFPDEILDAIAERAAAIVLEQLASTAPESELMTVDEAAEFLRCKRQRIYDLLSAGRLHRHRDGSRVLVSRAELVAHLLPPDSQSRSAARSAA